MGFLSPSQPAQDELGDIRYGQLSSARKGRPVPWGRGHIRCKAVWITPALNRHTSTNHGKAGPIWWCNIMASAIAGPVDEWHGMILDDWLVPWHYVRGEEAYIDHIPYPDNITNHNPGQDPLSRLRLHWGLENPPQNNLLFKTIGLGPGLVSGANIWNGPTLIYNRVCFAEIRGYHMGRNNQNRLHNTEFALSAKPNLPAEFAHLDRTLYPGGVNPVGAWLDFACDPIHGLGRDPEKFDVSYFEDLSAELAFAKYAISPYIADLKSGSKWLSEMLEYFDGFLRKRGNVWQIGRIPEEATTPETYTTLTVNDYARPPALKRRSPKQRVKKLTVTAKDWASGRLLDKPVNVSSMAVGEDRDNYQQKQLDRLWFVAGDGAREWAKVAMQDMEENPLEGSLWVLRQRAVNPDGSRLLRGDVIRAVVDVDGTNFEIFFRIQKRTGDAFDSDEVKLDVVSDRGQFPRPHVEPVEVVPDLTLPEVQPLVAARVFQLPWRFHVLDRPAFTVLAVRGGQDTVGAHVHYSADGEDYGSDPIGTIPIFAQRVTLDAPLNNSALTIDITATSDADRHLENQTDLSSALDTLLMIIGEEIITVGTVTVTAPGQYALAIQRGRYGSIADAHAAAATGWIIRRADIEVFTPGDLTAAATRHIKLQPSNAFQTLPLSDEGITELEFTTHATDIWAPDITSTTPIDSNVFSGLGTVYVGDQRRFLFSAAPNTEPLRRIRVALYYSPDNDPESNVDDDHVASRVLYDRDFPATWQQGWQWAVDVPAMSVGWHGLYVYVEDARGGAYTTRLFGWFYANLLPAPTGLDAVAGTAELLRQTDGTIITRAKVTWTGPTAASLPYQSDPRMEISYRPASPPDQPWETAGLVPLEPQQFFISNLKDNMNYDFRIRILNAFGWLSSLSAVITRLVQGKAVPPLEPTGLSGRGITATSVLLRWTPPDEADFRHTNIYRNGVNIFDEAELVGSFPGNSAVIHTSVPDEIYYYWAESEDTSRLKSDRIAFGQVKPILGGARVGSSALPTGTPIVVFFSASAGFGFRSMFTTGDDYMFWTRDSGATWGTRPNFVTSGTGVVYYFIRSATQPATPTHPPTGWSNSPPSGTARLWITSTVLPNPTPIYTTPIECLTESGGIPPTV